MNKTLLALATFTLSTTLFAQQEPESKPAPAYGDNPNLIKVLAVKAQEKVQSAAEKVGAVTEKGIAKIKPSVDNTWQNTKEYTTEQATLARDNTRQGIDTAVQKVKQTKENLIGTGGVPIERGALSQSTDTQTQYSTAPQPSNQITTQNIYQNQQPSLSQADNSANSSVAFTPVPAAAMPPQDTSEFSESEIKRQSIPIQSTSAQAPVNAEPAQTSNVPKDDDAGLPR